MIKSYLPSKKADQVAWAANVAATISGLAIPLYGVPAAVMTTFTTANTNLQTAWAAAQNPATRTKGTIAAANNALITMRAAAKPVVGFVQANPAVTDTMKVNAGMTVRKTKPSPKPTPDQSPNIEVDSVSGRTVTIRLRQDADKRAKPTAVQNALVFSYIGAVAPMETNLWTFVATTTASTLEIPFGPSATGDTVWITAMWVNAKSETGPAAKEISVNLPAGGVLPVTEEKTSPVRRAA
jgi:hypothetical protein